jgi:2-polyprenyl-3-methyl-5-hydroxy-6-metoxy-1,4-benzoquinol methylase
MADHIKDKSYYANARVEMLQFIPDNAQKILEVGCGEGKFSAMLTEQGKETWAIEPNPASANIAAKGIAKVFCGTIDEKLSEIPDETFDVIVMNDVIEHLTEPWDDIQKLKSKLKKDGVFVSSIPNVRYAKNLFHVLFKRDWKYSDDRILDITHYRFFTKKSIRRLWEENGYSVQKMKGINRTKSFAYFPFAVLLNIVLLLSQLDVFYMQYATVAKKK